MESLYASPSVSKSYQLQNVNTELYSTRDTNDRLVGCFLRIYVALAIFQQYRNIEAEYDQILKL